MAKPKPRQGHNAPRPAQNTGAADAAQKVEDVVQGLAELPDVPQEVLDEVPPVEPDTAEVSATQVKNLYDRVRQAAENYKVARERVAKKQAELNTKEVEITEQTSNLDTREADLAAAEKELESKRLAAKAGFVDELRVTTREVSAKIDAMLLDAATWAVDSKAKALEAADVEYQRIAAERAQLDAEQTSLREREAELRRREADVSSRSEFIKAKEASFEPLIQRRVAAGIASVQDALEAAEDDLRAERDRAAKRGSEISRLRNELARFGNDPEGLQRRVDELTEELRAKKDELARRPAEVDVADLRSTALRVTEAEADAAHWRSRHDAIDAQLRRYLVNVGELEVLRDERDALTSQRETLRQAIAQQKSDWEELQAKESSSRPFPACADYDEDKVLMREVVGRDFHSLADLVVETRNRMATNPTASFYYSEADVRLFLAGLAASRLHLLQGISGTGKTSLPREFFKALAGDMAVEIVEVQAGWRDKDDLLGYYNAFEKRFAESEFTKALYRALLPANTDRPMVIVLDEMNLAHPEQYFSVMLSKLENSATEQEYLDLLTSEIPNLPKKFAGSRLPFPRNVWFVGTANHDETTVAFADKTYDRAHVQTLPSTYVPFQPSNPGKADPVSFDAMERAFTTASHEYSSYVLKVKAFLAENIRQEFEKFGVGWGNRLERQIGRFVPVVLDGGGDLTEAVDHLIATKLVRKLEDRFGVSPDDLDVLADNVEVQWDTLEPSSVPTKTLTAVRNEAKRLRGGFGS